MSRALWIAMLFAGCIRQPVAEPPPPLPVAVKKDAGVTRAAVAPVSASAKATIACLFQRGWHTFEGPLDVLAKSDAPAPVVRMAAFAAIDYAQLDGDSPAVSAMMDAIGVLNEIDDDEGLRAVFALVDATPGAREEEQKWWHRGSARARAGLPVPPEDVLAEPVATARETAIAGDPQQAQGILATLVPREGVKVDDREDYIGALAALGRTAEIRAAIAKANERDAVIFAGAWLLTVMRSGAPSADALAAVHAVLAKHPAGFAGPLGERAIFARAARAKRGAELAGLYKEVKSRYEGDKVFGRGQPWNLYELATAVGDAAELKALAAELRALGAESELADFVAVRTGPLDAALTVAMKKTKPEMDLLRLWARSMEPGTDPAFGARLAAVVCPKPAPPPTPAVAGLHLTVDVQRRKSQFECDNQDVVVRLSKGEASIAKKVIKGACEGACTAAAKLKGEKTRDAIERRIDRGAGVDDELDFRFSDCIFEGPMAGRIDQAGDRDVALLIDHYIGPHDIDEDRYRLALEICGKVYVTGPFGEIYSNNWAIDDLTVSETDDGRQIVVEADSDRFSGVIFRLTLPVCPAKPIEQVRDAD
jgi:hypothetical protein